MAVALHVTLRSATFAGLRTTFCFQRYHKVYKVLQKQGPSVLLFAVMGFYFLERVVMMAIDVLAMDVTSVAK
jgi:hypothetical protein